MTIPFCLRSSKEAILTLPVLSWNWFGRNENIFPFHEQETVLRQYEPFSPHPKFNLDYNEKTKKISHKRIQFTCILGQQKLVWCVLTKDMIYNMYFLATPNTHRVLESAEEKCNIQPITKRNITINLINSRLPETTYNRRESVFV